MKGEPLGLINHSEHIAHRGASIPSRLNRVVKSISTCQRPIHQSSLDRALAEN